MREIIGKTISGLVLAEPARGAKRQVLLTFTDGTFYEFHGGALDGAAGVDAGNLARAASYARLAGYARVTVHPSQPQDGLPAEAPAPQVHPVEQAFLDLAREWRLAAVEAAVRQLMVARCR